MCCCCCCCCWVCCFVFGFLFVFFFLFFSPHCVRLVATTIGVCIGGGGGGGGESLTDYYTYYKRMENKWWVTCPQWRRKGGRGRHLYRGGNFYYTNCGAHIYLEGRKEGNFLFNDALNTFYLRLYGVTHMVNDYIFGLGRQYPLLSHCLCAADLPPPPLLPKRFYGNVYILLLCIPLVYHY